MCALMGENGTKFCGRNEADNVMVWEINIYKLRGNLITWDSASFPFHLIIAPLN